MTKRPSLFPTELKVDVPEDAATATDGSVRKSAKPAKGEAEALKTSLYLSRAVHDKLREIAFHERKRVHDLVLEGLDLMLEKRRYPSTAEITNSAKPS